MDPEPAKIVGHRTRRDEGSPSDWVRVMIDSFHDKRSAFEFAVNPAGVKQDTYWFNDSSSDEGWDAVWDVSVSRKPDGWRAEFKIPFSQLRFQPTEATTFGLAFVRQIGRLNETSTWPLLSKNASGYVSSFGELTGLRLDRSPKRLEMVPYIVGDVTQQTVEAGNSLLKGTDPDLNVGLDIKYALRPGLTLTGTVNPDFGQVEADPAVVNLSAFETFFSERRPFFVEGSGIFRFDTDCNDGSCSGLFYSRRIGRAPRGEPDVPDGGYASAPRQTTIIGASKLTGRVGGFSVGALNALTAEENAVIADGLHRTTQTVEPFSSYSVVRAKKEFANQSSLGFITTSTNRNLDDATRFLPGQAYTGGVDWDWRFAKRYAIQGYWAGSSVLGDPAAIHGAAGEQRPQLPAPRFIAPGGRPDADIAERLLDAARAEQDCGPAGSLQLERLGEESRLRLQRRRLHAARRPAQHEQLDAVAERQTEQVSPQLPLQPESMGWLELRQRPAQLRRERQRSRHVPEQLGDRSRHQRERDDVRRPRDARRPRCVPQRSAQHVVVPAERQPATRVSRHEHVPAERRPRQHVP